MAATVIDGKALAAATKAEAAEKVKALKAQGINPCLVVILVGENPASQVYVRGKINDCAQCGIESRSINLPADTTQDALLDLQNQLDEAQTTIDALESSAEETDAALAEAQRENQVELQKIKQGYQVTCHISGGDMDLMAVTLYVPDRAQAEMVKRSFYKDPAGVYKLVLASLTKDTSLAREYFIERQEQL